MRIEHLDGHRCLDEFDCRNNALNEWLRIHALENQIRNLSRTFVLVDDVDSVIGYYSLTVGGVRREELPKSLGRGLPTFSIGTVLLGRIAISTDTQGQGFGRDLMIDAIIHAAAAGENAAARFIAVDPIDATAQTFYEKFGFRSVPGDEFGRMFLRIDEAVASLELPEDDDKLD